MLELNLDLDGVFADFYGVAASHLGCPYQSLSGAQAWAILDQIPNLFRDLPMLPDANQLWVGIQAFAAREGNVRLRVLSAYPLPTNALVSAQQDKRQWVSAHLSSQVDVVLVPSGLAKCVYVSPGAVLIDDLARNIDAWRAAGGIGILHVSAEQTLSELFALTQPQDILR